MENMDKGLRSHYVPKWGGLKYMNSNLKGFLTLKSHFNVMMKHFEQKSREIAQSQVNKNSNATLKIF